MRKECLITTGATAKFVELIKAALSPECLQAFVKNGFTHLIFQCGECMSFFEELKPKDVKGLHIKGFDFKESMHDEMRACQEKTDFSEKGLVICHAGAGTILDAMRLGLSLIVVPNDSLLDNHQEELAEELEKQGYVTKSTTKDLSQAITLACKKEEKPWGGQSTSFGKIVDRVVGYADDIEARLD